MTRTAVIGSGSWGTALLKTLSENGKCDVYWWVRQPQTRDYIAEHKHNPRYLRSVDLKISKSCISTDLKQIIFKSDIIIVAIPSVFIDPYFSTLEDIDFKDKIVVSATKGLIPKNNQLISEYFINQFHIPEENFIFLTGPSHAEEVVNEQVTYLTLAGSSKQNCEKLEGFLANEFIRIRTSKDVIGLEYAAILKNIYAIAAGICHSLGYGDNFITVLVSNAIRELNNFLDKTCPGKHDIMTSGYLGDLLVTSFSSFSRNRTFGSMIGHGYQSNAALLEMKMIPEGYYAVQSFFKANQNSGIKMNIAEAVYRILYEDKDAVTVFNLLEKKLN